MADSTGTRLVALAGSRWPEYAWDRAEMVHGAFHLVLIPPQGPVLRAAVGTGFRQRAEREAAVARRLSAVELCVPTPQVLAGPVALRDCSATLISRVPGRSSTDLQAVTPGRLRAYAKLLGSLRRADPVTVSGLPAPRSWCGGAEWPALVETELAPLLDAAARRSALARVADLLAIEETSSISLCHGDFGPHNILWANEDAAGLIDLDHACLGDPAIDVAPLIGFHGIDAVASLTTPDLLGRAMIIRATLPLQVAAAAHLVEAQALRDHALANFVARTRAGTLFDPGGAQPH